MHKFKTTNIKGKEYVEVNERIKFFRTCADYKGYSLLSEIVSFDDASCIVKATITDAEGKPIANGYAQETKAGNMINKTSMLENCETSAWGRALGNLGIGIDTSIATAEEVGQAIAQQEQQAKPKQTPEDYLAKNIGKVTPEQQQAVNAIADAVKSATLLHSFLNAKKA